MTLSICPSHIRLLNLHTYNLREPVSTISFFKLQLADLNHRLETQGNNIEEIQRQERMATLLVDSFTVDKSGSLKENVINNTWEHPGITVYYRDMKYVSQFGIPDESGNTNTLKIVFHSPALKNDLMAMKGRLLTTDMHFK